MTASRKDEIPPDEVNSHPHPAEARSTGGAELLRLLRQVESAYRNLSTKPTGQDRAQACVDDLILRHGVSPPAGRRAVALFLANRRIAPPPPEATPSIQPTPGPKRMPTGRRRLR